MARPEGREQSGILVARLDDDHLRPVQGEVPSDQGQDAASDGPETDDHHGTIDATIDRPARHLAVLLFRTRPTVEGGQVIVLL